ncbi:MAG TPA: YiiX/YebB-like N1pC/P60 family cysteine hydrolase [Thermoanaerobaculia bacterium]|nr:YiiX/YebB-like N1pC/P60 family cysteine hydrolase [Thermoanaerobaculia bacterium]
MTRPLAVDARAAPPPWECASLSACLRPADVLLVEGNQRVSRVISYLTISPWSHAALYVGDLAPEACRDDARRRQEEGWDGPLLLEALAEEGVVASPLAKYRRQHVRICRPRALSAEDRRAVIAYAARQLGKLYDVDNILDLARYFLPASLVPARLRRDALHFGAGKPTEVMCSSLLAAAFSSVSYPILPLEARLERRSLVSRITRKMLGRASRVFRFKRAPATLIVPRDFDQSPYFEIVKPPTPEVERYRLLPWDPTP